MVDQNWDVVIVGGGPGGATAGYYLAKAGLRTLIVEKETFPRYAVGEGLLPYIIGILRDMNVLDDVERAGFMKKYGAIFGDSNGEHVTRIKFTEGLQPEYSYSYQVPRDQFDTILLEHAKKHGVAHLLAQADGLIMDGDRVLGVEATGRDGEKYRLHARLVMDISGRATFIGRKLHLMEPDPKLDTASVFTMYEGVPLLAGEAEVGDPLVLTFQHGWFWFIPFSDGRQSVGVVIDRETYDGFPERSLEAFFDEMVQRAGGRVASLLANAKRCEELRVLRKFAKRSRQFAGPGWVQSGDAAMFIDPVFAAGVYVSVYESKLAAEAAIPPLLAGEAVEAKHFEGYSKKVREGYDVFGRFIYSWQDPDFRRFFFANGPRPKPLVQTITTILSGGVFDRELIAKGEALFFRFAERDKAQHASQHSGG